MDTKHTPGPWKADRAELKMFCRETGKPKPEVRHAVSGKHGQCICAFSEEFIENAAANARLIASAPEMLDALMNASNQLTHDGTAPTLVAIIDRVIAEATGAQ